MFIPSVGPESDDAPGEEDRDDQLNVVGQSEDIMCSSSITRTTNDSNNEPKDGTHKTGYIALESLYRYEEYTVSKENWQLLFRG